MAVPKIFISSTCYDLKYIRENLKYFIANMGYESVLSEDGDVFYNPEEHTHDACLNEVKNCQIFVLIIGGRYGGKFKKGEKSITNKEYEEAVRLKLPVFTLVERNVLSEHHVYQKNKGMPNAGEIIYPSVDDIKIFEFIDEVRKSPYNNAIFPFADFRDIESYLKKQWAGMVYDFLTNQIETRKVSDLFEEIHTATDKIEYYTRQVALQTGDAKTAALIKIYEHMTGKNIVQTLKGLWGIDVTPYSIITHDGLDGICIGQIELTKESGDSIRGGGPPYRCSKKAYERLKVEYDRLRTGVLAILSDKNISVEDFLADAADISNK